jgi:hypothetical protein
MREVVAPWWKLEPVVVTLSLAYPTADQIALRRVGEGNVPLWRKDEVERVAAKARGSGSTDTKFKKRKKGV